MLKKPLMEDGDKTQENVKYSLFNIIKYQNMYGNGQIPTWAHDQLGPNHYNTSYNNICGL